MSKIAILSLSLSIHFSIHFSLHFYQTLSHCAHTFTFTTLDNSFESALSCQGIQGIQANFVLLSASLFLFAFLFLFFLSGRLITTFPCLIVLENLQLRYSREI